MMGTTAPEIRHASLQTVAVLTSDAGQGISEDIIFSISEFSLVAFHLWIDFLNITYVLDYKTSEGFCEVLSFPSWRFICGLTFCI